MIELFRGICYFNDFRKCLILTICICLSQIQAIGQDPIFSQYYAMPMHINPGFSGISYAPRIELIYRNQWPALVASSPAYVSYAVSYDQFFEKMNSGIGFQLMADDAGAGLIKTIKGSFTYGYQTRISKDNYLRGGIELGLVQTKYGWDKFIFGDQLDPEFGAISPGGTPYPSQEIRPDKVQSTYLDIGTGLLYFNPYFNIGFSAKHINSPANDIIKVNSSSYSGIPIRWVLHGSARLPVSGSSAKATYLSPSILFARQSEFLQINAGAQIEMSTVFGGLWYRLARNNSDALIAVFGVRKAAWRFAYSFDYTTSALGISSGGSHELSIGLHLEEVIKRKTNISDCFEAFR
ncbi:MAG: PorP/SprF family type IX secretion system membrane protein [Saprospiraceae bacterium]|nr:PorP/SprF family type IX secretion system membrane protein [Saprospiraceae bacterium]